MAAYLTQIKSAQQLLSDKIMGKLRNDPKAYGKVSVEVTIQAGAIQNIQAVESTSVKPE